MFPHLLDMWLSVTNAGKSAWLYLKRPFSFTFYTIAQAGRHLYLCLLFFPPASTGKGQFKCCCPCIVFTFHPSQNELILPLYSGLMSPPQPPSQSSRGRDVRWIPWNCSLRSGGHCLWGGHRSWSQGMCFTIQHPGKKPKSGNDSSTPNG